jgi:geranylgeranyl pyrophosphate synthase
VKVLEKNYQHTSAACPPSGELATDLEIVIKNGLKAVNAVILENSRHENLSIQKVAEHVLKTEGKRLRARLVLASWLYYNDSLNDRIINLASTAELFHTASLLHDDVMDEAPVRRGRETVNAKWDSKTAVLLGDYILSKTFKLLDVVDSQRIFRNFVETAQLLGEGALTEQFHKDDLNTSEKTYIYIITRKTAAFFRMCASIGAMLSDAPEDEIEKLGTFGLNYGIAFQITDDLLDVISDESTMGKPRGQDILEGHLTLPIINYFAQNPTRLPSKKLSELSEDDSEFTRLLNDLNCDGILLKSYDKAADYINKALSSLDEMPNRPALDVFRSTAKDVLKRKA